MIYTVQLSMFILFAYRLFTSATRLYYHVAFCLSTTFFNFFQLVSALSKKAFKTRCFSFFVVAVCDSLVRLSQLFLFVNNFFKTFL